MRLICRTKPLTGLRYLGIMIVWLMRKVYMIIRKEYLNAISEMNSKKLPVAFIARVLNLAAADVAAAIKSFKL